jgi:hypothetical protein
VNRPREVPFDRRARAVLAGGLRRRARGQALIGREDHDDNSCFGLERTLLPTIVACSLVRFDPQRDRAQQKQTERWLNHLVRRGIKRPQETQGSVSLMNAIAI